jgi:hypothetical protein
VRHPLTDLASGAGSGAPAGEAAPRRRAVLAGTGVLGSGFGVLSGFWASGQWSAPRPGHPDYRSGTVGDAVLLPLLVGGLAGAATRLRLDTGLPATGWACAGGLLGAAAGASVQWSWWADPAPRVNWTLPAAHDFSAPGWYHAVFLTATSGLIGALLLVVLRRSSRLRAVEPQLLRRRCASRVVAVVSGSALAFLALVALDSAPSASTSSSRSTLLALLLTGLSALPVLLAVLGPVTVAAGARLAQGALGAGALLALLGDWPTRPGPALFAAALALTCGVLLLERFEQGGRL